MEEHGAQVGEYTLCRELGRGSFGNIYAARHKKPDVRSGDSAPMCVVKRVPKAKVLTARCPLRRPARLRAPARVLRSLPTLPWCCLLAPSSLTASLTPRS